MRMNNGRRRLLVGLAMATALAACSAVEGRETAGQYVDDTTLTTKVKAAIVNDQGLKGMQINVETMQGVVQLSGFVDTSTQATQAESDAQGVTGVKSVRNSIVVRKS
jgi:hyperosmotically inducible periplasmic protein